MTDSQQPENEKGLQQLAWAIESSVGQFKLILARCNYASLRDRLIQKLREICQVEIRVLAVQQSRKTLYTAIQSEFGEEIPACVMVVGLESVQNLSVMLSSANQVREEFRKNFAFPLVLWIDDEIYKQLIQLAPDLESWATTRNFAISTQELVDFIIQTANQWFSNNLKFSVDEGELELQVSTSETQRSTFELGTSTSEAQRSTSELGTSTSEAQRSTFELGTSTSEAQRSTFELETSTSEAQRSTSELGTPQYLISTLKENEQRNLRTVLIFDQFEEFFFVYTEPAQRKQFFEFLGECLNVLSVKVILSLRVDYIHYLLECNDLSSLKIIGNDILSNNVLYKLGNFSPADTKSIIQRLTENTSFHLEDVLVEQLVLDLAGELGEVRPIELQVVGAQLQTENITTLAQYRQRGTKDELVKRYLDEVVNDCGEENQQAADILLYLLTDEKGTRPLKTRAELERDLFGYFSEIPPTPLKRGA